MVRKADLNASLDIVIIMTLDHYAQGFFKWLGMLNALIVARQYLSKLLIKSFEKSILKYGKELAV